MQFLQTDLLEMIRSEQAAVPFSALQGRSHPPRQTSLLEDLPPSPPKPSSQKSSSAFKSISEAADILGVQASVLRFWETQFLQIKPTKSRGGRRYYRPEDMEVLSHIKTLLYKEGYTIKGARKALSELRQDIALTNTPVPVRPNRPSISDKQKAQLIRIKEDLLDLQEKLSVALQEP